MMKIKIKVIISIVLTVLFQSCGGEDKPKSEASSTDNQGMYSGASELLTFIDTEIKTIKKFNTNSEEYKHAYFSGNTIADSVLIGLKNDTAVFSLSMRNKITSFKGASLNLAEADKISEDEFAGFLAGVKHFTETNLKENAKLNEFSLAEFQTTPEALLSNVGEYLEKGSEGEEKFTLMNLKAAKGQILFEHAIQLSGAGAMDEATYLAFLNRKMQHISDGQTNLFLNFVPFLGGLAVGIVKAIGVNIAVNAATNIAGAIVNKVNSSINNKISSINGAQPNIQLDQAQVAAKSSVDAKLPANNSASVKEILKQSVNVGIDSIKKTATGIATSTISQATNVIATGVKKGVTDIISTGLSRLFSVFS